MQPHDQTHHHVFPPRLIGVRAGLALVVGSLATVLVPVRNTVK